MNNSNIQPKARKCKGHGKAKGFTGCGELAIYRKYGLCKPKCFSEWVKTTDEGKEHLLNSILPNASKNVSKANKARFKQERENIKTLEKLKGELQTKVNKIARLIDFGKGCISCEHGHNGMVFTRKKNGGHFHSVGKNPSLRFNLDNIYLQDEQCNQHLSGNDKGYIKGLIARFGEDYYNYLMFELPKKYSLMKFDRVQIMEAKKIADAIIKEVERGYDITRIEANKRLNLYK